MTYCWLLIDGGHDGPGDDEAVVYLDEAAARAEHKRQCARIDAIPRETLWDKETQHHRVILKPYVVRAEMAQESEG